MRLCALIALGVALGYAFSDAAMAKTDIHSQQPGASAD
jgi:hypothetical protein